MKTNIIKINEYMEYTNGVTADVFTLLDLCDFTRLAYNDGLPFSVVLSNDIWNIKKPFFFLTDDMEKENRTYIYCVKLPSLSEWERNKTLTLISTGVCDTMWNDEKVYNLIVGWLDMKSPKNPTTKMIERINYVFTNKN